MSAEPQIKVNRLEKLSSYKQRVADLYDRALENTQYLPEEEAKTIKIGLEKEYSQFTQLTSLINTPHVIDAYDIAGTQGENFVKRWRRTPIPKLISIFSCSTTTEQEFAERKSFTKERLTKIQKRYETAKEVLKLLSCRDKKMFRELTQEYKRYNKAFKMYQVGFSHTLIEYYTGEKISNYIKHKSVPPLLSTFSSNLSNAALISRKIKADLIRETSFKRYKAKEKKKQLHKDVITKLKQLDLVLKLYEKGLPLSTIEKMTKLPARMWIRRDLLPVRKVRAVMPYSIPLRFNPDSAYILGAYLGRFVNYLQKSPITFTHKNESDINQLKTLIEKTFKIKLPDVYKHGDKYCVSLSRSDFFEDFKKFYGINHSSEPNIPEAIIKDPALRTAFLQGYLSFEGVTINPNMSRLSITRSAQPNIIKTIAIALYLEDIYCNYSQSGEYASAYIGDVIELKKIFSKFPNIGDDKKRATLILHIKDKKQPLLSSYQDYQRVMEVINENFRDKKIDFSFFFDSNLISETEASSLKRKIQYWKDGNIPDIARKHDLIQNLIEELYPNLIT